MNNRILQLLEWRLGDIKQALPCIKEQGFTAIQISPIQPLKEYNYLWWMLYQPCSFNIGNRWIGDKEDLIDLCNEAKKYDIKIVADVICNHMAGKNDGSPYPHENVDMILSTNKHFWKEHRNIKDWENRWEVINHCMGLPGLRLDNYDLQDIIIKFLNELIECGVRGFRFDAAKNIQLPEEGSDFWVRVLNSLNNKDELLLYAEVIFSPKYLIDKYCKYINVLTNSFGSDKSKLITYIESHDSYLDSTIGVTRNMSDEMIIDEYKVLCQTFDNTILYNRSKRKDQIDDLFKNKKIKEINNIRR